MQVPFVDLRLQHDELRNEIEAAIGNAIDTSTYIGGPLVERFEAHFAAFCNARHAVACANGTDALKLALMACGVRPGDEVITVPHTFIATVEAITLVGGFPAFVDIDGPTYNLSPVRLAEFLERQCQRDGDGRLVNLKTGRRVVAIMPVHIYGLPADMEPILALAKQYGLKVIEDACQAHGAAYCLDGVERQAGSLGDAAGFSFYPGKNLGAIGEGGAVTTNDEQMNDDMRIWRDHGQIQRYVHVSSEGWNSRLDSLQCAVLDIKLTKLEEWNRRRQQAAQWYRERLADDERVILPIEPEGWRHVYHLFVVRLPNRERARHELAEKGIGVGLHYPIPLHLQAAYQSMGYGIGDFPESERAATSILSLPIFPHITEEQVDHVCGMLREHLDSTMRSRAVGSDTSLVPAVG